MRQQIEHTIEDMVRAVLAKAIQEGLVAATPGPEYFSSGELVGVANMLDEMLGKQQKTVWAVECTDYRGGLCRIFSNIKAAGDFAKYLGRDYEVQEWDVLDIYHPQPTP